MTAPDQFTISLTRSYPVASAVIVDLFKNNTVFELTGADTIENNFKTGGSFHLGFNNRGSIHGHFLSITNNEIILEWNVDGFNKPQEIKTNVQISWRQEGTNCVLTLIHKNIAHEEAAKAKEKAWTEILDDIGKKIMQHQ